MTFVPRSSILPRVLWRPAMVFFALAQIVLAFAPLMELERSGDSRPHVEEAGTSLHHAHNEADCTACVARVLLATSEPARQGIADVSRGSVAAPRALSETIASTGATSSRSRAPPVSRA